MSLPVKSSSERRRGEGWFVLALLAVALLALGLRLWALDAESLWLDEAVQVNAYQLPLPYVVIGASDQGQPPLDYLIGAGLHRLGLADSDWWVRFPAALFGAGSVFLLGWWVGRIGGRAAGVTSAILLAVCPLHVAMSQEARPYTIFFFFALATVLAFARARQRHTLRAWGLFACTLTLLLMTRWVGPHFITMGLAVMAVCAWLKAHAAHDLTQREGESRKLWAAFTAVVLAYAVYGPIFGVILYRLSHAIGTHATPWFTRFTDQLSDAYTATISGYSPGTLSATDGPGWVLLIAGAVAAVGLILLIKAAWRRRDPYATLFAVALVPFPFWYAGVYAKLSVAGAKPQYLLLMAAPLLGCIALAAEEVRRSARRAHKVTSVIIFVGLIGAILIPMAHATFGSLCQIEKRDWRGVMTHLRHHAETDDSFACVASDRVPPRYSVTVSGLGRYFKPGSKFLKVTLDTPIKRIEEPPWSTTGSTVWIVCYKDRFYSGKELLPTPTHLPPDVQAHEFTGLFLMELPGEAPAAERLMDGLALLARDLPDGSALVAPNVLCGKYLQAHGKHDQAERCFHAARRQCRDDEEVEALLEYLPHPNRERKRLADRD